MDKRKITIIGVVAVVLLLLGGGIYYSFTKQDKSSTLTLLEKQWIEKNKNNVIDLSIPSDIPIFDYNGQGVLFDFIGDLEKDTGLEFNKVSYSLDKTINTSYYYKISDKTVDEDILIYVDHYVLLSKEDKTYIDTSDIGKITVGVVNNDMSSVSKFIKNSDVTYKSYDNFDKLFDAIKESEVDAVAVPRIANLNKILDSDSLYISYHITDMKQYYSLHLGDNQKLNVILKKYFNKWYNENFKDSFNDNLSSSYFTFNNIDEKSKSKFRSKRYTYGFVENKPYDSIISGELKGINNAILSNFANVADIEIDYKSYENINSLIDDFNKNRFDLFLSNSSIKTFDMDVYNTNSYSSMDVAFISHKDNDITIKSVSSLEKQDVYTIKDSKIGLYLQNNNVVVKTYNNINELIKNANSDSIIAIDYDSYRYYLKNKLSNYKMDYLDNTSETYYYTVRDIKDNKVFYEFLSFYLSFENSRKFINNGLSSVSTGGNTNIILRYILLSLIIIAVVVLLVFMIKNMIKNRVKKPSYRKESKIKYIDMLTSLKNRNYLNDHIETWDNSEVYPQTIIIVDLNNVAYINDNYGHQEGDNVIKEAANVLIKTQIENSDIIRTDGNEFLIYLVGYEEKEIVSYIKKLTKELKELAHGFGAAIGYSMINDGIKTIDDAVNEATLAMRDNKEEI